MRKTLLGSVLTLLLNPAFAQIDTLRLLFAGDVMGNATIIESARTGSGVYDYKPCFKYIRPVISNADVAFANLEVTLPGAPPYTGFPQFRSPDVLADALQWAGFDVVVTANNHSNDSYGAGVVHTIETLRKAGLRQTGTFKNEKERTALYPLIFYEKGFKLALLNYTFSTNGIATEHPTIVNRLDTAQMALDLARARAQHPHFIMVFTHWGVEYELTENAEQRRLARFLIRHGADLVVGAHPHVAQPIKKEVVDGRTVLVAYSIGNFISNMYPPHSDGGILLKVELVRLRSMPKAVVRRYGYIPIWTYIQPSGDGSAYYTLPVAHVEQKKTEIKNMSAAHQARMLEFTNALRQRLGKQAEWRKP